MDMQAEVAADVVEALRAAGGDSNGVSRGAIVKKYMCLGGKRASLFVWISKALASAGQEGTPDAIEEIRKAAVARLGSRGTCAPALDGSIASEAAMPQAVEAGVPQAVDGFGGLIGPAGAGLITAMEMCVQAARDVMKHSRREDGTVRAAKSLLAASEHLRRVIETIVRIQERLVSAQKIESFYQALVAEMVLETPALAARVLARLESVEIRYSKLAE